MFLGFLLTSLSSYFFARSETVDRLINQDLPIANDSIYSEVQRDLLRPKLISSVMANNTFAREWLTHGEKDIDEVTRYLSALKEEYGAVIAFLVSENEPRNYYYEKGILTQIEAGLDRDNWYFRVLV